MTGRFGEGVLDGCLIECPRHGARFDVRTGGAVRMPAATPVRTFAVRIENGDVYVEIEEDLMRYGAAASFGHSTSSGSGRTSRFSSGAVHDHRLVYLDNAATTQKPRAVIEALQHYYERTNANIHRGIHTLADEATVAYEDVRSHIARFLGGVDVRGIVFTRNATEAINLVARSWVEPSDSTRATRSS